MTGDDYFTCSNYACLTDLTLIRTIYLPDSQAGRLTWGDFDYNESDTLTLSSTVIGLIQSAQQAVT